VSRSDPLFAVTAPGLERITADELRTLGIAAVTEPGGAAWTGDAASVYRANLHLRTATRILVRMGEFRARTFFELERHARRLPWSRFLTPDRAVALRVTCHKSRLHHQGAVAQRFVEAVDHVTGTTAAIAAVDDPSESVQLVVVRFVRDVCTVSSDASGSPLYQRGYRQALARAPLRETLAAAMIHASGWDPRAPLFDPLCGSGTIAIEAALIARRIPPGLARDSREPRDFAFLHWPGHDERLWRRIVEDARASVRDSAAARILASDRQGGALRAARANADRAGVSGDIEFDRRDFLTVQPPDGSCIVTNPPYGRRAGRPAEIRAIQERFEQIATSSQCVLAALVPESWPPLPGAQAVFHTRNGGLAVRFEVRS